MKTICPCCLTEYDDHDSPEEFKRLSNRNDVAIKLLGTLKSATAWIRASGGYCDTLDSIIRESENTLNTHKTL